MSSIFSSTTREHRLACRFAVITFCVFTVVPRGVMVPPVEQLTADGYDLQFGTNVLGAYHRHSLQSLQYCLTSPFV